MLGISLAVYLAIGTAYAFAALRRQWPLAQSRGYWSPRDVFSAAMIFLFWPLIPITNLLRQIVKGAV